MKGIALAIETIIFIILAVLVLTILIFFFTSQVGPADDAIKKLTLQREACQAYINSDPKCANAPQGVALEKLRTICPQIEGLTICRTQATSLRCALDCCRTFCALAPAR